MHSFSQQKNSRKKEGFTLIETLVAISVLLGAVITPMVIASQGIAITTYARDQVIAAYLAQDAVEYVIAKKKQNTFDLINALPGVDDWLEGLEKCGDSDGCTIDTTLPLTDQENATTCPSGVCPPLKYHDITGAYGYGDSSEWVESRFTRKVHSFVLENPEEAVVIVIISWKNGITPRSFTLKTNIYATVL